MFGDGSPRSSFTDRMYHIHTITYLALWQLGRDGNKQKKKTERCKMQRLSTWVLLMYLDKKKSINTPCCLFTLGIANAHPTGYLPISESAPKKTGNFGIDRLYCYTKTPAILRESSLLVYVIMDFYVFYVFYVCYVYKKE